MPPKKGFTIVELLVVIGIIGALVGMLLPALSGAREAALAAGSAQTLAGFGKGIKMYQAEDADGRFCSGAFDHLRDGDVRSNGWVADQINTKSNTPGKQLDPANSLTISRTVLEYTGCINTDKANPARWGGTLTGSSVTGGVSADVFFGGANGAMGGAALSAGEKTRLWDEGYNSNYATSWQFVRGDPTIGNGTATGALSMGGPATFNIYGEAGTAGGHATEIMNTDARDYERCPLDGDGPLSSSHFTGSPLTTPDRVPLIASARAEDSHSRISPERATTINAFAGKKVCKAGEMSCTQFCDGMRVNLPVSIDATARTGEMMHEFHDIQPLHGGRMTVVATGTSGKAARSFVGGFGQVLFADCSVRKVKDVGGLNDRPDGQLGVHGSEDGFLAGKAGHAGYLEITQSGYDEIRDEIWARRVAMPQLPGGGVQE